MGCLTARWDWREGRCLVEGKSSESGVFGGGEVFGGLWRDLEAGPGRGVLGVVRRPVDI